MDGGTARLGGHVGETLHERAVATAEEHGVVGALDHLGGDLTAVVQAAREIEIVRRYQLRQVINDPPAHAASIFVQDYGDALTSSSLQQHRCLRCLAGSTQCTMCTKESLSRFCIVAIQGDALRCVTRVPTAKRLTRTTLDYLRCGVYVA